VKENNESQLSKIIDQFSEKAKTFIKTVELRSVSPTHEALVNLKKLDVDLQNFSIDSGAVINELDSIGSPATVASTGGRYFGFVIGGSLPAALGANLLAGVWDQNAFSELSSPIASYVETVCRRWLNSLLNFPVETEVGFVTGATMANFTALAAARHSLLAREGWNVEEDGLFGAPNITVIVGDEVHASLLKALSLVGFGKSRVVRVPTDGQGRMRPDLIPDISGPTIVCIQAGNVNTGAFDPADLICEIAHKKNAWVHVDGAFGLWASAVPEKKHLTKGLEKADSWAIDAHKWLNVPYDCGIVFVKNSRSLTGSMSQNAAYLLQGENRDPVNYVPEMSRRARGIEVWAALRSLGKKGLIDLINRNCALAVLFADKLRRAGFQILNDVELNQVLVSFGNAEVTNEVIKRVQEDGTCWCGGTIWKNQTAMRISVSSWRTTEDDVEKSANAIIRIANEEIGQH
jgi:glutamate/tyrosine decarboxylase-like PLP-dependent enzyme